MEDMEVADHARKIHERDSTKATATKRILARSEGTRSTGHYPVCLVVGFSSVFLPFNRGKRSLDAISTKVVLPHFDLHCPHWIQKLFQLLHGNSTPFRHFDLHSAASGCCMGTHSQSSSSQLVLFALGEHTSGTELGR
jgi:hypothetical protein